MNTNEQVKKQISELVEISIDRATDLLRFTHIEEVPRFFELLEQSNVELHLVFSSELDEDMCGVKKTDESLLGVSVYSLNPREWIGEEVADALLEFQNEGILSTLECDQRPLDEFIETQFEDAKDEAREWQIEKSEELKSDPMNLDNVF